VQTGERERERERERGWGAWGSTSIRSFRNPSSNPWSLLLFPRSCQDWAMISYRETEAPELLKNKIVCLWLFWQSKKFKETSNLLSFFWIEERESSKKPKLLSHLLAGWLCSYGRKRLGIKFWLYLHPIDLSIKSPCLWASFHPLIPSFSGICKARKFY
jgi:hypothetical protein